MAYRNEYKYKGGTRRVRESKRNKKLLRVAGWCVLCLFIGMFVTHLIFSVVAKVKRESAELDAIGVPPVLTIQDQANSEQMSAIFYDGSLSDSYQIDSFIAFVKSKGMNTVVLDLKPESGILGYKSNVALAKKMLAVPEGAVELESITLKFKNADIKLIARLSVCADDIYALANPSKAAREAITVKVPIESSEDSEGQEGEIREEIQLTDQLWLDSEKHAWGSPYDEKHREYICELISEITAAGVDSILIDNVFFPSVGDGNDGEAAFDKEEESDVPRAGIVRTNVSFYKSAALSGGARLFVAVDARAACGEQDQVAGTTFNVFELDADGICPVCMPSELTKDGITSIADYSFESAESADIAQLYAALIDRIKLIQGAIDEPPAFIPIVQAYTDTSVAAASRREWTQADLATELAELEKQRINGKVLYGTQEDYELLIPQPVLPESSVASDIE